jgi:energy-coupling factor transporter ATP-binding protein EcfA2
VPPVAGSVAGARPGMVFQDPAHQFVAATVRDEIAVGLAADDPRIDDALRRHRLEHVRDASPHRLSGGEKRRLSLAAMLVHDRPALLADEPTFGLDRRDAEAAMTALADASRTRAVLFSSHDLELVARYATRAVVLGRGTVIHDGGVDALVASPALLVAGGIA